MIHTPQKTVWEYFTKDHGILRITVRRVRNWDTGGYEWDFNAVTRHGSLIGMPCRLPDWGRVVHLRECAVDQFEII